MAVAPCLNIKYQYKWSVAVCWLYILHIASQIITVLFWKIEVSFGLSLLFKTPWELLSWFADDVIPMMWSNRVQPQDGAMCFYFEQYPVKAVVTSLWGLHSCGTLKQVFSLNGWLDLFSRLRVRVCCVWLTAPVSCGLSPSNFKVRGGLISTCRVHRAFLLTYVSPWFICKGRPNVSVDKKGDVWFL